MDVSIKALGDFTATVADIDVGTRTYVDGPHGVFNPPGRVATGRIKFLDEAKAKREGRTVADVTAESVSSIPVGRYGEPLEYGQVVVFLASKAASYITGSVIRVDGGYVASV